MPGPEGAHRIILRAYMMPAAARIASLATAIALAAAPAARAETMALPKPGLVVEWRQSAQGQGSAQVRQEIVSVNGTVVSYREISPAVSDAASQFETWRGLVLIKRHIPQSAAFVESTLTFELDMPALEALLPLAPGRGGQIAVKGRSSQRLGVTPTAPFFTADVAGELTIRTERREAVHVPAGRFETIVIRHETTLEQVGMGNRATIMARIWFAPALGWPVKKHQLDAKGAIEGEAVALAIRRP